MRRNLRKRGETEGNKQVLIKHERAAAGLCLGDSVLAEVAGSGPGVIQSLAECMGGRTCSVYVVCWCWGLVV